MRKGTKKRGGSRGGSRGGRKTGASSSASKNDDAVVEATTTQETQPTQETEETEDKVESPAPEEEGKNEEEANENQEEEAAKVESKAAEEGGNEEEAKEDKEEEKEEAAREDKEEEEEAVKPDESASQKEEAKGASSSEPQLRRGKRKRGTKTEAEKKVSTPRAKKRAKTTKAQASEPEYFEEKRNLEDLWKATFSVGTEWDQQDALNEFNWDFTNLEEALEEGGELYGKQVYVFGCTEFTYKDENKDVLVPVVVCIDSPIPPSDEIGVASVQGEVGEIIAMKTMKMAWVPYIPLEQRDRQVDNKNFPIFILGCTQRRSALKHLPDDRVKKFNYCLPYINNPYKVDDSEKSTVVKIMFPSEPPVECEYDWVKSVIEEFTDSLINEEVLLPEQKVAFEEFVKEKSDKAMAAYDTAQEALEKAKEGLSEETKKAYQEMRLYKFYPLPSPDTPHTAGIEKVLREGSRSPVTVSPKPRNLFVSANFMNN
ncbi:Serine/Threonine-kinase [Arabidopsis thaliana]|uniref:Serine/Threonine-kinase n=1 Tax=Arabidopsis thaliana TaxID=3702 RepID=F4KGF3_ARATH|nr:Serine/Threonine-kinase [Arabidopsis thaliana]AED97969.1 Serine/Threonine-kinase [Arabidopsis thaliana]|eukprot:NP_001190615.1 Serine/Threonine-kinase [Arabidopsis thaliana]